MDIIIADDDALVLASLKTILEADGGIHVAGTAQNGEEAVALYERLRPDIALFDIQMPVKSGLTATAEILSLYPEARILFLTTFADNEYIVEALNTGAKGYILKQDFGSIVPALQSVMSGQSVFGGAIVSRLPSLLQEGRRAFDYRANGISEREEAVIALVAQGLNNREIAQTLFLSAGTVRNYLSTILDKLDLRDRTQLAVFHLRLK